MSPVSQLPNQDERFDQASMWITKMDRGLSSDEEIELASWMAQSNKNRDLLLTMAEQWDKMDSLSRLSDVFPHSLSKNSSMGSATGSAASVSQGFGGKWTTALVACFVFVLVAGFFVLDMPDSISDSPVASMTYETAVGEQSSIFLPDGSQMRLNTNTLVEVLYSEDQRLLNLARGELNVEVAHDSNRPLRVVANNRVVEAVGTEFNVEITNEQEVELVVTDGKVLVTLVESDFVTANESARTNSQLSLGTMPSRALSVSAGEEVLLGTMDEQVSKIPPEDIRVKLSWHQGNLTFRGESLEQAMTEVGRYTAIEFVFMDEQARQVRIAGLFKAGDMNTLLATLRENFNITYEHVAENKILLSSL